MVEEVDVAMMCSNIENLASAIAINFACLAIFIGFMHCAVSSTIYIQLLIE
jgi:hypothetical protein